MAARNFASPAEVLLHRSPEGGPLSSLLCCPRTPIDERQRNAEHRLNLSNAEVFTDSSAHHENCPLQANHAPWPKAMTEMASGSETEKKPAKAMSYTSYPMMPGISEGATSVAATSMRESENETEVMSKEMNESQSNLSESREDPSTSSPQKKDTKGYFGLGKMSIDNIEGIGAKIKTGLGLKAIVKQTEKFSTGEMLKQQTDDASFKQFLALVMKANLDTDNDDEKSLFTNVTSGKESKKIMPCGLFPRTQMVLSQCCELIVSSWVCHFLSFAFLVLHCIGLVLVINHATVRPELWRGLSTGYFVFFLMELLVRWVGEKQSGWILFDVFLALLCILEAILPLTTIPVGQGQFTVLALRLLRVVRRLQFVPRESKAAIASFGLLPAGVVLLVCVIWSFLAVIWFLILDTSDITSSSGNATIGRLGGRTGNRTQDPLVIAVPQFQNYGSAWLTQLYLAGKGMNWRRITDGISGSTLNADVLRLSFVLLLVLVSLVTTNAMIVLVYELAEASSADFQLKIEAELVRKRLFGLHSLEEKLMAGIESREEEFTMLDRTTLEKSLVLADEELKAQGITADELLQLFDHLLESSTSTGVMISELLFGVLLLTAPAGEADNLQVDYLQKKCIEITDAANGNLQNLMNQSRLMLDTMEVNFSALQAHLSKLRSSARKTAKEVKQNMLKVEAQIEECARSVDGISQLRKVQLSVAMQKARLEIQERLERSKMTASQLDSFNSLSRVFGFPALSGKASMPQIEAVQHLLPPERAVEAVQQRQMSERERQFQLAAALLRAEVKDRLEKKLQHHFQSTADDQDEGNAFYSGSTPKILENMPEVPWGVFTPMAPTPTSCARSSRHSDGTAGGATTTPSKIVASTPSRIINIRTPLRPCSKQRSKEFQDDIRCALEEQSAELLRVALQRRHACPRDHALHEAVRQANCAAVRLLLENSAEPNDRCLALDNGEFPLQLALSSNLVRSPERLQMVELLLEARADVGQRRNDPEGHTPLHDGVRRGDPGVVLLLLRHGADPNVTNAFGEAPLELAVRGSFYTDARESLALVETLIQWGACPVLPGQGCKRVKKRDFLERVKLPLQPSLQQVIGVLHRVDPALGNLAETVSKVWGVLQTQLAEQRCLESSDLCDGNLARTGTLLLHLFALGRLKCSGFQLPSAAIPLVSAAPELAEAARYTRLAVASYGANVLALVGLLQFWDAWPPAGPDRDKAAAARYLQLPPEKMLACGTKMPKKKQDAKSKFDSFKPWWVLIEDQDELILSIRGSANIDDIATDLACATCDFLDGYAHEGMAGAVAAVWEEANVKVLMLGKIVMMEKKKAIHAGDYKRFVVCGHSLGGSVSLLLGMKLRAESSLPLEVHAFAAGPAPCFQGGSTVHLEKGLISVINRFDPVPHLSLDAALRMILAAERLAEAGLSWQQTLSLVAPLRIPGEAIWLVDACAGRQMLPVALPPEDLQRFCQELPEISVAQSALDHVMSTYVYNMDKAAKRLEESDGSDDDEGSSDRIEPA
eukprot:symbB.v1.2.020741.t3/scaffold1762.1/size182224/8